MGAPAGRAGAQLRQLARASRLRPPCCTGARPRPLRCGPGSQAPGAPMRGLPRLQPASSPLTDVDGGLPADDLWREGRQLCYIERAEVLREARRGGPRAVSSLPLPGRGRCGPDALCITCSFSPLFFDIVAAPSEAPAARSAGRNQLSRALPRVVLGAARRDGGWGNAAAAARGPALARWAAGARRVQAARRETPQVAARGEQQEERRHLRRCSATRARAQSRPQSRPPSERRCLQSLLQSITSTRQRAALAAARAQSR
jgi:hypothetical protein